MKKINFYTILVLTALGAGIFISFIALRSSYTPPTRTVTLPGFTPDPNTTLKPIISSTPTPTLSKTYTDVPFTPQAPFSEWSNPKLSNGCEEASALMAMSWIKGELLTPEKARREILAISDYEEKNYGVFLDTSAKDTLERIFKGYYKYQNVELRYDVSAEDIKNELRKGNLVITPMNGQELKNPYYTPPGPLRHMVVITGYDPSTKEFVTNDPGTRLGEKYRYPEQIFMNAISDYLTGDELPLPPKRRTMIVIRK